MSMNNILIIKEFKYGKNKLYGIFDTSIDSPIDRDISLAKKIVTSLETAIKIAQDEFIYEYGIHFEFASKDASNEKSGDDI